MVTVGVCVVVCSDPSVNTSDAALIKDTQESAGCGGAAITLFHRIVQYATVLPLCNGLLAAFNLGPVGKPAIAAAAGPRRGQASQIISSRASV